MCPQYSHRGSHTQVTTMNQTENRPETGENERTKRHSGPVRSIHSYCLLHCERKGPERLEGHCWLTRGYLVANCPHEDCPLWPFRQGRNPARAGIGGSPTHRG